LKIASLHLVRTGILLLLFIFSVSSWARLVVVSDIDDTLKIARVGKKAEAVLHMYKTCSRFLGMSEMLHEVLKDNDNVAMFYLTNAPKFLLKRSHLKLLERGEFPVAPVYFRKGLEDGHKIKTLKKIIREQNPTTMILIGDNAEEDIKYYDEIATEYKDIRFVQFIRKAYDKRETLQLRGNQVGFVSPIDIVIELNAQQLLSKKVANLYIKEHVPRLLAHQNKKFRPQYLPKWIKCPGFQIPMFGTDLIESQEYLTLYEDKITDFCSAR
jgi:hypothetical protein